METLGRVSFVVVVLVLLPIAAAAASEPAEAGVGAGAQNAPESGRADAIPVWSVDSGGGASSGGDFSLIAAIGQPDVGLVSKCGTALAGGLWAGTVDLQPVFCNGFESGGTGGWSSVTGGTK